MDIRDSDAVSSGKNISQKTIRDKLLTYLSNESIKQHSNCFEIQFNRQDLADKEQSEINVIERFLPKQMSASEVETAIKSAIETLGASSMKDMGKVMPVRWILVQRAEQIKIIYPESNVILWQICRNLSMS